jgi:hypothetical protein
MRGARLEVAVAGPSRERVCATACLSAVVCTTFSTPSHPSQHMQRTGSNSDSVPFAAAVSFSDMRGPCRLLHRRHLPMHPAHAHAARAVYTASPASPQPFTPHCSNPIAYAAPRAWHSKRSPSVPCPGSLPTATCDTPSLTERSAIHTPRPHYATVPASTAQPSTRLSLPRPAATSRPRMDSS